MPAMRVLYVKGLSPTSEEYDRLSLFCVLVLAAGGDFNWIIPANRNELWDALASTSYDLVYYRGHGSQDGNWILLNDDVITQNFVERAIGPLRLVVVCSTSCFSHKWTKQADMLRFIGSSSSYKPFENGCGLFNYFLGCPQCLDTAADYLPRKWKNWLNQGTYCSDAHYSSTVFQLVEGFYIRRMIALNINLRKLVPNHYSELKAAFLDNQTLVGTLRLSAGHWSGYELHYPRGFIDWRHFVRCMSLLRNRLGSNFVIHGSSISGYRFRKKIGKGLWFDNSSDYDIAVCNEKEFARIVAADGHMEKDGNRTREITLERNIEWFPVVHGLACASFPRTVNFVVYKTIADALRRPGLSLVVNVLENDLFTYVAGEQLDFLAETIE